MLATDSAAEKHDFRVLVVDDNQDAADSLAVLLGIWGYPCQVNYDGASALQTAREYRPDCLLLDINMPGMDGYAVAQRIRLQPELRSVKLVALTAYSDETTTRRIREAGFDYHFVKTVELDELKRLITMMVKVLELASHTEELARQNVALASETKEILHDVKEQISEVKDKLEDVTQGVRELKHELREVREDQAKERPENE